MALPVSAPSVPLPDEGEPTVPTGEPTKPCAACVAASEAALGSEPKAWCAGGELPMRPACGCAACAMYAACACAMAACACACAPAPGYMPCRYADAAAACCAALTCCSACCCAIAACACAACACCCARTAAVARARAAAAAWCVAVARVALLPHERRIKASCPTWQPCRCTIAASASCRSTNCTKPQFFPGGMRTYMSSPTCEKVAVSMSSVTVESSPPTKMVVLLVSGGGGTAPDATAGPTPPWPWWPACSPWCSPPRPWVSKPAARWCMPPTPPTPPAPASAIEPICSASASASRPCGCGEPTWPLWRRPLPSP
mmetsp:Transcript_8929/g.27744  ORF Transcript_8929/g.27744 Transcript_8929/m.27744 type:complete len:316 (+) Transcript_8929:225-1172(+)